MAKHIHIHLHRTKDAGTAHDPGNGQFTSGGGGGGAKKSNPLYDKPKNAAAQPGQKEMEAHPNYNKEDHDYLKGKGWTNSEIHQRWTAENKNGQGPAKGKGPKPPDIVGVVSNPNFYKKK